MPPTRPRASPYSDDDDDDNDEGDDDDNDDDTDDDDDDEKGSTTPRVPSAPKNSCFKSKPVLSLRNVHNRSRRLGDNATMTGER